MPSEFVFALRYRDFASAFSRARFSTSRAHARRARAERALPHVDGKTK